MSAFQSLMTECGVFLGQGIAPNDGTTTEYSHPSRTFRARFYYALLFELACLRLRHHNKIRIIMIMEQYLNEMEEYNRINPEMIELTEGVDGHFR